MKKKFVFLSILLTMFTASCTERPNVFIRPKTEVESNNNNNENDDNSDNNVIDNNEQNINQNENKEPTVRKDFSKLFYRTEDYMSGIAEERIIYFHDNYFLHQKLRYLPQGV